MPLHQDLYSFMPTLENLSDFEILWKVIKSKAGISGIVLLLSFINHSLHSTLIGTKGKFPQAQWYLYVNILSPTTGKDTDNLCLLFAVGFVISC